MKTALIFSGYYLPHLGGVERYVSKLAGELLARGYRVVIATSRHQDSLPAYEQVGGVTIYRLPLRRPFKSRYPIPAVGSREFRDLHARLAAESFDHVILNTRFHLTSLIGARLGRSRGIDPILVEHGTAHFTVGNRLLDFIGKGYEHAVTAAVARHVTRFYGVSQRCNEWLTHFGLTARGTLYNAIDPGDFEGGELRLSPAIATDATVITYAGRLLREKGIIQLMDAFADIDGSNTALVIAGDGPLLDEVNRRAARDSRIRVLGYLDFASMKGLLRRTDIFVHPSLYPEGLPTSILEAALLRCAIVATPRGGTEEILIDDDHGTIVDGSVAELHRALEALIADPSSRSQMADRAHERVVRHFTWTHVVDQLEKELTGD